MTPTEFLTELLIEKFDVPRESIRSDADLASLGIDSLSMIELVFDVEDEFDIQFPEDVEFKTLGEAVALIEQLIAEQGG
ncbi:MAG: acyl carrier protein [Gemmatimonadota bacterium]